ncbi:helix-turn-helix domain-containing protein [Polyangium sp. 6x1]|uniref:helix-turn-helix domain-containing protein n=1 Tax=Polyangium sp. 6x1 TaxID=3042689 RepID=UPI0024829FAA|nr:helix-turn-helix domain-containing protein [Polyangium sp. 6x1]MDI1444322.1 helix-turn-helix domain-containing protein [Polyangium sp. 6x1]
MPRRTTPDPISAKIGARIRLLRAERLMSLVELANVSGLNKGHLSSIEQGLVRVNFGTLVQIATGLGVQPMILVTFPDEHPMAQLLERWRKLPPEELTRELEEVRGMLKGTRVDRTEDAANLHDRAAPESGKRGDVSS